MQARRVRLHECPVDPNDAPTTPASAGARRALRLRRRGSEAVPLPRGSDGGRIRHGSEPVRAPLRAARRPQDVPSGREGQLVCRYRRGADIGDAWPAAAPPAAARITAGPDRHFPSAPQTYEVYDDSAEGRGRLMGIFIADNYARVGKQSGAWMSELRTQSAGVLPIVTNNNNFARGEPATLLSFDDATTLFHEFGHGLHGLLSAATYQSLAGTSVLRDFVELPSQLFEHWLDTPEVLRKHARHYITGEPLPDALLAKLKAARTFNQGFATVEYTASALMDQALHALPASAITEEFDLGAFEAETLARLRMPRGVVMRHRPPHFNHLFASSSYAAAYFVYLAAEVLDADAFDAFTESEGGVFDAVTAAALRRHIYAAGNTREPGEAFRAFRGRDPFIEPMLRKKGLLAAGTPALQ